MTDTKSSNVIANSVDHEFRWQTVLTHVKHPCKIVKMMQHDEALTFQFEKYLIEFLKTLTPEQQQTLEERSLTSVDVQPPSLDTKAFEVLKEDILIENESIEMQFSHCKQMPESDKKTKWLLKIAKTGHSEAQFHLAYHYHLSKEDFENARYWYTKSSEQGYEMSKYNLAALLLASNNHDDKKTAFQLFCQIAQNKFSEYNILAHMALGSCYEDGSGVTADYKLAFECYLIAANKNNGDAQCKLGLFYEWGNGVEKDEKTAFEWYSRSYTNGVINGQYCLALCYRDAFGTAKNQEKAFVMLLEGANDDHPNSQYSLGKCYMQGLGVAQDKAKAVEWYNRAAKLGNIFAQQALDRLALL